MERTKAPDWKQKSVLTVRETAVVLGVSADSAYRAVQKGEIPSLRIGGRIVVPTARLAQLLGERGA